MITNLYLLGKESAEVRGLAGPVSAPKLYRNFKVCLPVEYLDRHHSTVTAHGSGNKHPHPDSPLSRRGISADFVSTPLKQPAELECKLLIALSASG